MFLILFVLHNADKCDDLLDAWEETGVGGITILHSTGLGRVRGGVLWDDLPLVPSLESLMEHEESFSRTLFTVVESESMVEQIVAVTQKTIGDLSLPNTGLLVVLPVVQAYGLQKQRSEEE